MTKKYYLKYRLYMPQNCGVSNKSEILYNFGNKFTGNMVKLPY